jgi:thioesterase domain-containing protein/acyl carrier protein
VVHFANKDSTEGAGQLRAALLAAPASERQALAVNQVRDIVAKVLRTSPSKLDTQRPLKETGLDSLMAVELLTRLESEFAISLPPGKLGAGGTISTIATVVLETLTGAADEASYADTPREKQGTPPQVVVNDGPLSECLLALRAGGSRPPLFCIHPGGGLANVYETLAECLPDELPVYGIQSRAYQDERGERDSAEALARDYASLIIERQPSGPCHLAGFSVGGLFALATACELERRGRTVAFVGLIDTQLHLLDPDCPRESALQRQIIEMYSYFAAEMTLRPLASPELSAQAAGLARKVLAATREEQLQLTMNWLADQGLMFLNDSASIVKQYLSLFITHSKQANEIVLNPVGAPVWHWRAADTQDDSSLPAPASGRFTSVGVFEETIEGGHYALMQRPGVAALATSMEAALQAATNPRMPSDVELAVK